ncbi:MAG: alpha/beta hydrolase [Acidimicrobiia bacterium]|nr:alpha/beta hydrolase [Acidimicrobiia bacterium]
MKGWSLGESYDFHGQAVRYGVIGSGSPMVLVHGTPFSSYVWHRIAPYLVDRYEVFFYDLLGYGQSEMRDGQDVSLPVQNELLAELLVHWGLDRPDIVGHDIGGTTALRTYLLNGREYRNLVLIDPVALRPWCQGLDQTIRGHEGAFSSLSLSIHTAIVSAYIRQAIRRAIPDDELAPYLEPWLGDIGQAAFYRQMSQCDMRFTDEIEARYGEVRCPTFILWGEEDRWLPIEQGLRLKALIPSAEFRPVAGAGHLVQEDAPESIVATLLDALG